MPTDRDEPDCATAPFLCRGEEQFVTVKRLFDSSGQVVRRRAWPSKAVLDETICPVGDGGCAIEAISASPSGEWLVTRRSSGQGEWGYDVFRTCRLAREAGVLSERGYLLELPRFSEDESRLVGGFGRGWLGGWWAQGDDDIDEPVRGGPVSFGFLFVHLLPSHRVTRHELRVDLPRGWLPDDPEGEWYGPGDIAPTADGVRLLPSWGVPVEIRGPLPPVIVLPTPHPSGEGLL
jgi:hypothetical protein